MFTAAQGLSLVVEIGAAFLSQWAAFSLQWLLLLWSLGSAYAGLSSCSTWVQWLQLARLLSTASVVVTQGFSCSRPVGSSQTRGRTGVPCIARWILTNWTTREVLMFFVCFNIFSLRIFSLIWSLCNPEYSVFWLHCLLRVLIAKVSFRHHLDEILVRPEVWFILSQYSVPAMKRK